ncbi:CASP C terminal-domain-containing protein [Gongronella butleri]|nr:CASP C terminal-domain-containing protein [Gongronella butleri]
MAEESSYSAAIQYWKGVNLNAVQRDLDEQGLAIVENQKDGLVSRKRLAEQTREFKKLPDESKLNQVKGLLKGYQSEIDSVTRRTKYAENAFLTIYKLLADAPDPLPLFEAAVEESAKLVDYQQLEARAKALEEKIDQQDRAALASKELAAENAQLKQKIAQLEAKVDDKKSEDLANKEQEMKAQYNEKIRSYKEREHDLQLQLNQALTHLNQLKATHEDTQAQLIDHNQQYNQDVVAKLAELDIIMMDMERANARIIELEKRNDDLKQELVAAKDADERGTSSANQDTQHEAELNRLIKDVDTYKNLLQKSEARTAKKIKDLTNETKSLKDENASLQAKLKEFDNYHEIKRELDIMKYVEFSAGDEEDAPDFNAKDVLSSNIHGSLEVQLMEKNKKMENNHTQLRVQFTQLQQAFDENQRELEAVQAKFAHQQQLVQRLEDDLARGVGHPHTSFLHHPPSRTASPNPNAVSPSPSATAAGAAAAAVAATTTGTGSSSATTPGTADASNDQASILPIVMQQRDRFRQRNNDLEQKSRSLEQQLSDLQSEMEQLRQDNLKLYERLKFVHVWKEEQRVQNRSTMIPMNDMAGDSRRTGEMDRYDQMYEENMNPFAQFHRKEERRRYNALNPADKLTLKMSRMMFSHRWSRYFLIGYALLLHLLVAVTLHQLALWECRHDHEMFTPPQT